MARPRTRRALIASLTILGASLLAPVHAHEGRGSTPDDMGASSSDDATHENPDPLGTDAAHLASDVGISLEAARAALERQPLVGRLTARLDSADPRGYGGIFIDYRPEYRIALLAQAGRAGAVAASVGTLGFSELEPYIVIEETPYTADALESAMNRVRELGGTHVATLDMDIRTGDVLATGLTSADVDAIRSAVASSLESIGARQVIVERGSFTEHNVSYGGLHMRSENGNCTAGFSVRRTTDDASGVANAGHCPNSGVYLHDTLLDHVDGKWQDSQDVQWFKTPGMNDPNKIKDGADSTRTIESRTDRSEMTVGGSVCHYGQYSGYGCGTIASKSFDPGERFNATWIRVEGDDTTFGDSGGPWFLGFSAYGTHSGETAGDDDFFMAQNYMRALDIVVKTH